jgi:integrase
MGRTPTTNRNLPKGLRARRRPSGIHYYLDTGETPRREIPVGKDYVVAVQKWAEWASKKVPASARITFRYVAEQYMAEVMPTKAIGTQKNNIDEVGNLYKFFDDPPVPLDDIEPVNVRAYLDWRWRSVVARRQEENAVRKAADKPLLKFTGREGQVVANREKALLSHIWNFARNKGFTKLPNPCAGIKGFVEDGRNVYIEDQIYNAVWAVAEQGLQDAMDIAYLSAQRKGDLLEFKRTDLKDGHLPVEQNKTGKKLRISVEGQLAVVVNRINSRKVAGIALISNDKGERMTEYMLRGAFDRARVKAIEAHPELAEEIKNFQFRDLRAKAATDKDDIDGLAAAQDQLGHTTPAMTAHYVRHRRGKIVKPTK